MVDGVSWMILNEQIVELLVWITEQEEVWLEAKFKTGPKISPDKKLTAKFEPYGAREMLEISHLKEKIP